MSAATAPISIITFFEQYGSGGSEIAHQVAERLGVPYMKQALSSEQMEAAEHEARDEENLFEKFLRSFSPMPTADADITWALDARTDYELVVDNTKNVMEAVKETGGVLMGRNATVILANEPGSMHVKIKGPLEARLVRAAAEAGIDEDTARKRQEREDRVRVEMSKRLYHWDPSDDRHYDLVVDTGAFTVDQAVDLIVHAYRLKFPA